MKTWKKKKKIGKQSQKLSREQIYDALIFCVKYTNLIKNLQEKEDYKFKNNRKIF